MYTAQEIQEIRDALSGKRKPSEQEVIQVRGELAKKKTPNYLYPFIGLFATNPDIYAKLEEDPHVHKYSYFGFLPESFDLVYGNETSPQLFIAGGNRGLVGILRHPSKNIVIKPWQSMREKEIAQLAGELGVGPKQYPTIERFLTEEFVDGILFSALRGEDASPDAMYQTGRRMGEILTALHEHDIYYNDTSLSDDFGRSHVIIPKTQTATNQSAAILFDYGVAIKLDKHPDLSDEEVFDFARTLPAVSMMLPIPTPPETVDAIVRDYLPALRSMSKEEVMARDVVEFINAGLIYATYRIGDHIISPFTQGFKETYKQ